MSNIIFIKPYENNTVFTSYCFYNVLLPQIQDYYKKHTEAPKFSFEYLNVVDPIVLPNIIGLGYYLSNYHKQPIELLLNYNPKLLYYLYKTDFFNICEIKSNKNQKGLGIFKFNDKFIGGFSQYIEKEQRKEHKVHSYLPNSINKSEYSHDLLIEQLILFTLKEHFETVLLDSINEYHIDECIESIAEPISNGILHSKSMTWAISQTTPKPFEKTVLSISDVGIGFKESLKENNIENVIITQVKEQGLFKQPLEDFYYIFESLYYSMIKNRSGLIDFILKVTDTGTVRIHYNSTQVLFTPRILDKAASLRPCRKKIVAEYNTSKSLSDKTKQEAISEIINLSNILLSLFSHDKKYSPIRIYNVIFKGVHIEFELPNTSNL